MVISYKETPLDFEDIDRLLLDNIDTDPKD